MDESSRNQDFFQDNNAIEKERTLSHTQQHA